MRRSSTARRTGAQTDPAAHIRRAASAAAPAVDEAQSVLPAFAKSDGGVETLVNNLATTAAAADHVPQLQPAAPTSAPSIKTTFITSQPSAAPPTATASTEITHQPSAAPSTEITSGPAATTSANFSSTPLSQPNPPAADDVDDARMPRFLEKMRVGAGWLLVFFVSVVVSGFALSLSDAVFWLAWSWLALQTTQDCAIRPCIRSMRPSAAQAGERPSQARGREQRTVKLDNAELAYFVAKVAIAIALVVFSTIPTTMVGQFNGDERAREAVLGAAVMVLALEGLSSIVLVVVSWHTVIGSYSCFLFQLLFRNDYDGDSIKFSAYKEILEQVFFVFNLAIGMGPLSIVGISFELLHQTLFIIVVVLIEARDCFLLCVPLIARASSSARNTVAAEVQADLEDFGERLGEELCTGILLLKEHCDKRVRHACSGLTNLHAVTFGLFIGGNFGEYVTSRCFWVCWVLLMVDLMLSGVFWAMSASDGGDGDNESQRQRLIEMIDASSPKPVPEARLGRLVFYLRLLLLTPLAVLLAVMLSHGYSGYIQAAYLSLDSPCDASCQSRCYGLLLVICLLAFLQAASTISMLLVAAVLVCVQSFVHAVVCVPIGFVLACAIVLICAPIVFVPWFASLVWHSWPGHGPAVASPASDARVELVVQ